MSDQEDYDHFNHNISELNDSNGDSDSTGSSQSLPSLPMMRGQSLPLPGVLGIPDLSMIQEEQSHFAREQWVPGEALDSSDTSVVKDIDTDSVDHDGALVDLDGLDALSGGDDDEKDGETLPFEFDSKPVTTTTGTAMSTRTVPRQSQSVQMADNCGRMLSNIQSMPNAHDILSSVPHPAASGAARLGAFVAHNQMLLNSVPNSSIPHTQPLLNNIPSLPFSIGNPGISVPNTPFLPPLATTPQPPMSTTMNTAYLPPLAVTPQPPPLAMGIGSYSWNSMGIQSLPYPTMSVPMGGNTISPQNQVTPHHHNQLIQAIDQRPTSPLSLNSLWSPPVPPPEQKQSPFLWPQTEDTVLFAVHSFERHLLKDTFAPFMSTDLTKLIVGLCRERFDGNMTSDSKILFNYIKQSITMQCNDRQLFEYTVRTQQGPQKLVIIRPDLHLRNDCNTELVLVLMENDKAHQQSTKWKAQYLMTKQQLCGWLRIQEKALPKLTRRSGGELDKSIRFHPDDIPFESVDTQNLDGMKGKKVKRKTAMNRKCREQGCHCRAFQFECPVISAIGADRTGKGGVCAECGHSAQCHGMTSNIERCSTIEMTQDQFKEKVRRSWRDTSVCPVVVNRGKRTWIEWKKFVKLDAEGHSVAVSLKRNTRENKWEILKVMDCDPHRLFSQHRLLGSRLMEVLDRRHHWNYADLKQMVNTNVVIV